MSLLGRLSRLEGRSKPFMLAMPELITESADNIAFRWKLNGELFGEVCKFKRHKAETLQDFLRRASAEFSAEHVVELPPEAIAIGYEDIGL